MTFYNDVMPYFKKVIHVHDCNLGTLSSPLKNRIHSEDLSDYIFCIG